MDFDRAGFEHEVGLRLQRARKDRGITQEELARRIGLPRPSYANIESGRQRIPLDVIWRAAVVLGVTTGSLVPEHVPLRGEPAPTVPTTPASISGSPATANSTLAGPATPSTEILGFRVWRESSESSGD